MPSTLSVRHRFVRKNWCNLGEGARLSIKMATMQTQPSVCLPQLPFFPYPNLYSSRPPIAQQNSVPGKRPLFDHGERRVIDMGMAAVGQGMEHHLHSELHRPA